jgi:endonuclease III
MLRDNVGIENLKKLENVPIPVDIHVARASLAIGVVKGNVNTQMNFIFNEIRKVWFESVKNLQVKTRQMIALDVDEPLWHLSKYGCTKRDKETGECPLINTCEAKQFCIKGKIVIKNNLIELET